MRKVLREPALAMTLFLVVGLLLGLFGTAWGMYFWDKSDRTGIPASTGTVMVAVLPVFLG